MLEEIGGTRQKRSTFMQGCIQYTSLWADNELTEFSSHRLANDMMAATDIPTALPV